MSAGCHGPFRSGRVGPNNPTMGAPTEAARCSGPVSPETTRRACRASPSRSLNVVGGEVRA